MDIFTKLLWVITIVLLIASFTKDREKTKTALKMSVGLGKSMAGSIFGIILLIGLILTFIPPEMITSYLGGQNQFGATVIAALVGSITLIPAFIAFPLVGTLVDSGVGIMVAVSFLTTLTMVGFVTFPLEKREFGLKFATVRNALSLCFAVIIALIMGVMI